MKRRELLRSLSIAAGSAICGHPAWAMLVMDENPTKTAAFAIPIRGLVRKDGKLRQPVQLNIQNAAADATAVTTLNGVEVDRRVLSSGRHTVTVFTPAVSVLQQAQVKCEIDGKPISATIQLQPVRKVLVYILPHSHHDLGYTDLQANVEEKQMRNITLGIELARRTATYPEGARFIWNLEVLWGADLFLRRKSEPERAALIEAIKNG
jgi:alpha-mannosidase